MTKVIENVVIGGTGSGKSHVLELIDKALRTEYGHHVQIASHDLSLERGLGNPGEKPRVSDTIFSLRERGVASGGGKSLAGLKIEVDTSDVDLALGKVEALQGFTTGYAIDPLESAIEMAARLVSEHVTGSAPTCMTVLSVMTGHLELLLELQLKRLSSPNDDEALGSHIKDMTRKLQSLIDVTRAGATVGV